MQMNPTSGSRRSQKRTKFYQMPTNDTFTTPEARGRAPPPVTVTLPEEAVACVTAATTLPIPIGTTAVASTVAATLTTGPTGGDTAAAAGHGLTTVGPAVARTATRKKRRIYDQYGKEGLMNNGADRYHQSSRHRRHNGGGIHDEFDIFGGFPFTFRDPEEVFREFFGGSPFEEIFRVTSHHHNGRRANGATNGQRHSHPQNVISSPFMSPFMSFNLMDDFFNADPMGHRGGGGGGFTSISEFSVGSGPVKRTSTSTTFVNGKKLMTKKVYENGTETIMSYENDVLKSKTVNGVAQAISSYNH
nr:dnaJ homolog subfamily B member 6-B-like isoform X2 [Aedes albopictus]